MTIEVGVIPEAVGEKRVLGEIVPGEFISLSDFSDNSWRVLSIICNPDNKGGLVYSFDNEGFAQTDLLRGIPLEAYTDENLEATIGFGKTYEREVITEARDKARLILTHMPLR